MITEDIVVDLIALNGGKLVGRTRLQKGAYLLHRCGANFDLFFTYHHYGPYSFELAEGCLDACAEGWIEIEEKPGRHGTRYAIFKLGENAKPSGRLGVLSADEVRPFLEKMQKVSDVVLELAATIVYFLEDGYDMERAVTETKVRKPLKANEANLARANSLIHKLGLDREAAPAPAG